MKTYLGFANDDGVREEEDVARLELFPRQIHAIDKVAVLDKGAVLLQWPSRILLETLDHVFERVKVLLRVVDERGQLLYCT